MGDACVNNSAAPPAPPAATSPGRSTTIPIIRSGHFFGLGSNPILTAVGVTGQGGATGAVVGAAKGASVGTEIVPGIGTAIGAVIGAIAGGLIHTSDYPQWLAEDTNIVKVLEQLPPGFQGRTLPLQTPSAQNPLTLEMIWTAIIVTGNLYAYVNPSPAHSPSDMQNEFNWVMAWLRSILTCMNQNPVGANLTVTCNVGNGVTFTLTFDNPGLADSAQVNQVVTVPAYLAWCTHNGKVDTQSNHCPGDASNPLNQLVLELMTDYAIAQVNPSAGAPQSAPPAPPAAAPAVATAPPAATLPVVTPAQTATVTVSSPATPTAPAAQTTVTAGSASTTATPAVTTSWYYVPVLPPGATVQWYAPGSIYQATADQNGWLPTTGNGVVPPGAQTMSTTIPVASAPPIAPLSPVESVAPIEILGGGASSEPQPVDYQTPAPISSGVPVWVYLLGGAAVLYVATRK